MEQQPHRACERTKSNWPRVPLFHLAYKQWNGIIKGCLHCLMSNSKGRFLVNNMLMFSSSWCFVMAQIQFSLIKKDWTSRILSNPPPSLPSDNISFNISLYAPQPPSKWTSYVYHPLLNWPRVPLFHLAHKQCNGIIK